VSTSSQYGFAGPMPMCFGSTPATAHATSRPSGFRPWDLAYASLASTDTGVVAVSKGASVRLVSDFQVEAPYDLMARSEIASVDGLRGKKIGVANLRGDVVAIVDARPLFGLPSPRAGRRQWTLVVAAEGLEAALVIDGVARLEAFTGVVPLDDPSAPHAPWTQGVLTGGEGRVPLLGSAKLLRALREER